MTTSTIAAARELLERRNHTTKFPRLSADIRPETLEDALAIQAEMAAQHTASVGGWKCLLPPGEDRLIVGPIFSDVIYQGDIAKLNEDDGVARVEPEIVFILAKDLPAKDTDYTEAEIDDAIGKTHMAFELMQSRFAKDADQSFPEALADILLNQGLYIGNEINKADAYQAATIDIKMTQASGEQTFEGKHPNPLPAQPVHWLINFMSKRGVSFTAGQAIITGSYAGIVRLAFDEPTVVEYAGLGRTEVTLQRR